MPKTQLHPPRSSMVSAMMSEVVWAWGSLRFGNPTYTPSDRAPPPDDVVDTVIVSKPGAFPVSRIEVPPVPGTAEQSVLDRTLAQGATLVRDTCCRGRRSRLRSE